ncbi:hypothetical protein DIZ76_010631 [Coccidioides immitis]|uniref:Peptidase S41 family protein n=1 Tax=Coccidioides immitis RMSCC 2394 TaxID=404692 RepID=A0A0J6Y5Z1_COCIT|nr:peptidase S41 family protein [Coccidioides immitis RMSCC 2394]TPX25182.1 hypothetical protein DIZ76_010631 [Coccidioides immitis]
MGRFGCALVSLALLSSAPLSFGRVLLGSDVSVLPRSKEQEPCALVAAAQQKQLSGNKKEKTFRISAELAHACLQSVPFKKRDALRLIDGLDSFWHWQSTIDYLKDPPEGYLMPATDLDKGILRIRNKAAANKYENEIEFQQDMLALVNSVHDGHFNLYLDAINIFSFRRVEFGPIVSLSSDGKSLPKVYSYNDLNGKSNGKWRPSAIKSIDGEDAQQWLRRLSYRGSAQDPDALYNALFYNPPGHIQDAVGAFFTAPGVYTEPQIHVEFENGTKKEYQNDAIFHVDFDGVRDGETFYKKFCSGNIDQAPMLKKREVELQKRSSASPRRHFPEPVVEFSDGSIAGYFLEGDHSDIAVLSVSTFAPTKNDDNVNAEFSNLTSTFLAASKKAGKKKLIVDVTSNGGGSLFLGFDLFMQLFPEAKVTSAFNLRATKELDIIGRKINQLLKDPKTMGGRGAAYERNGIFDLNSYVDVDEGKFRSWDDYFGPVTNDDFDFTNLALWDLDNEIMSLKTSRFVVAGYGSRSDLPSQAFEAEDIILLTDATCASTCAVLADLMKAKGVKSIVAGGRPRQGPVQAVGGVKGSQVLTFEQLFKAAAHVFELYSTPQERRQWEDTHIGEIYRTGTYVLARTVGDGAGGRINYRNAIHPDDKERIPRQFVNEPADCRIWHTPKTILDMANLWSVAANTAWGDDGCTPGSSPSD